MTGKEGIVRMEIEMRYDAELMHGDDEESIAWFLDEILSGEYGQLLMYSNEIGDTIGSVKVIRTFPHHHRRRKITPRK